MSMWRYKALAAGQTQTGELSADSAAAVRSALRRTGLTVLEVRPLRSNRQARPWPGRASLQTHLRNRRRPAKAEMFDSMATMLASGAPLIETLTTLIDGLDRRMRSVLIHLREALRNGDSFATAAHAHPSWFDPAEAAMIERGEHGGSLPDVLRSLADRHEQSGQLSAKLMGALAYPAIVACVGLGVVVFLSTKTLPSLTQILTSNEIAVPRLTNIVMGIGQSIAANWALLFLVIGLLFIAAAGVGPLARRLGLQATPRLRRFVPIVARRIAAAQIALGLAELLKAGVPAVESLRILAPTASGPWAAIGQLRRTLLTAADRVEHGESLSEAFDDDLWFDAEFTRLIAIGENSGELETLLERIGRRYERNARRLIDRMAALLEPAVILSLAVLVGLVVMAAILPLVRLQEIV